MSWSRRRFLRGTAGALVALPVMPSLVPPAMAAEVRRPRLVVIFAPNGMHMPGWHPATHGSDFELPTILQPFAPVRQHMTVLDGLANTAAYDTAEGFHARSTACFLTGRPITPAQVPTGISNGWSLDQRLATERDSDQPLPSLEVAPPAWLSPSGGGWPSVYHTTVSWRGNAPVNGYSTPLAVWNRLTSGGDATRMTAAALGDRDARRRSVLDGAVSDLASLRGRLGVEDAPTLDAYLSSVRALELRLQSPPDLSTCDTPPERGDAMTNYMGDPDTFLEIIRIALQCDLTRVVSFMISAGGSGIAPSTVDTPLDHHALSHHGGDRETQALLEQINVWESEAVSRFVQSLASTADGHGGKVLDDTVVLYGSGMSDGDTHSTLDCPILTFGSAGGRLVTGTHLDVRQRRLADLHLTLLRTCGVPAASHGDSEGVLESLLV